VDLDRELVDPIGEAWRLVEEVHVAAAVPLDESGLPAHGSAQPLHVYFPTEERTGFSIILQGDFALELDRRHVARSPQMRPYNEWMVTELASLVGEVAESLARRFGGAPSVVAALAPPGQPDGFGEVAFDACIEALGQATFVPTISQPTLPRVAC
jgi:hypothetical protein